MMLSYCAFKYAKDYVNAIVGGEAADQLFGACTSASHKRYTMIARTHGLGALFQRVVSFVSRSRLAEGNSFIRKVENKLIGKYDVNNWCSVYGFRDCDLKYLLRSNFRFEEKFDNSKVPDRELEKLFEFACTELLMNYALYGILAIYSKIADMLDIWTFSPYLDKRVISFVMSLDHSLRTPLHDKTEGEFSSKYLQVELARQFFSSEIIDRPKQGGAISPFIHLEDEGRLEGIRRKIRRSEFLNQLFHMNRIDMLFQNVRFNSTKILMLMTLDLWNYIFRNDHDIEKPSFTLQDYIE
jgi:hypothetical protein